MTTHNISIYSISGISGISYSTLNDIANGKVEIANVKAGILYALSKAMDISMEQLYELCRDDIIVSSERYKINGCVSRKNKKYYLCFEYNHKKHEYELCSVKKESSLFIESIALWEMEKRLLDFEMEETHALCIETKR